MSDLKARALVARSWVYPAQPIRGGLSLGSSGCPGRKWKHPLPILHRCPHLIRHIRRLPISCGLMTRQTFSDISLLQFTHVEEATFTRFQLSDDVAVAMEKLLSLPTLRRVEMHCGIPHFETVLRIWPRRSPPIKAVVLYCWAQAPHAFDSTPPHCAAPIKLESLTIGPACEYDDATVLSSGYCTKLAPSIYLISGRYRWAHISRS
ncbi:hypothetical protein B0H11DRAFT_721264 [Mycena galericulata]|nr:hypothetical protein B0H11DRAFT_721264 [Mycena galericulata]